MTKQKMSIRTEVTQTIEKCIDINISGNVQEYALNLLAIINNAREYPNMFIKVENHSNSLVSVYCYTKSLDNIKEWIDQFGTIERVYDVVLFSHDIAYNNGYADSDKIDKLIDDYQDEGIYEYLHSVEW